jgi:hypothetical protein
LKNYNVGSFDETIKLWNVETDDDGDDDNNNNQSTIPTVVINFIHSYSLLFTSIVS